MAKLKNVGVREFRDHATVYLSGSDPVAVSKHGQVIGFYIPVEADREQATRALEQLGRSVEEILAQTGMTEDELRDIHLSGLGTSCCVSAGGEATRSCASRRRGPFKWISLDELSGLFDLRRALSG